MNATDEVLLRNWQPADAPELSKHLNNMNILKDLPLTLPSPYTAAHARVFIGMSNCYDSGLERAIEYQGELAGGISLVPQEDIWNHCAEIRFFTAQHLWNRKIMQRALALSIREAFDDFNFTRLHAWVFETNEKAIHVLLKNGFSEEGMLQKAAFRDEKFHNVCLLSLLNQE